MKNSSPDGESSRFFDVLRDCQAKLHNSPSNSEWSWQTTFVLWFSGYLENTSEGPWWSVIQCRGYTLRYPVTREVSLFIIIPTSVACFGQWEAVSTQRLSHTEPQKSNCILYIQWWLCWRSLTCGINLACRDYFNYWPLMYLVFRLLVVIIGPHIPSIQSGSAYAPNIAELQWRQKGTPSRSCLSNLGDSEVQPSLGQDSCWRFKLWGRQSRGLSSWLDC